MGFRRFLGRLSNRRSQSGGANDGPPSVSPEPQPMTPEFEEAMRSGQRPVVGAILSNPRIVGPPVVGVPHELLGITGTLPDGGLNPGTAFRYKPLQPGRIRLLNIITPGTYPICQLEDFDLDNAPPYAALSYAWGLPITTRAIFCKNTGSDLASFSISEHVLEALNNLFAYVPSGQKIWIDAICIDQKNPVEKAHQIASMQRIYSQSQQVLCWLGPAANNSDEVIDNLLPFTKVLRESRVAAASGVGDDKAYLRVGEDFYRYVIGFFLRPWFHRLWVVQEILMARKLQLICGDRIIPWETLCAATKDLVLLKCGEPSPEFTKFTRALGGICELRVWREQAQGPSMQGFPQTVFVRLLLWACEREVTEPVDRIWALTGLAQPELQQAVTPLVDYSEDARSNFHQGYKAFAKAFLFQDERLWLLSLISLIPRHKNLPSWCPSFSYSNEKTSRHILQQTHTMLYHAGFSDAEPLNPRVRFPPATDYLAVYGFLFDRVITATTRCDSVNKQSRTNFDKECRSLAEEAYRNSDKALEAHSRTIIADLRKRGALGQEHVVTTSEVAQIYTTWRRQLNDIAEFNALRELDKAKVQWYNEYQVWSSMNRCYVRTQHGRVGLAPEGTAEGDWICIMYGATTPFIMRREQHGSAGHSTTLIGDAYIHGVMYGEALSTPSRRMLEEEFMIS